jgi:hypothetical protein
LCCCKEQQLVASQLNESVSYCFALLLQVSSGQPPFSMTTRRTMMLSAVLLWLACVSPAFAIVCYTGPDDKGNVGAADFKEPAGALCLRYQYICSANDTACTVAEVGKGKWAYTITTKDTCAELKALPSQYKNVTCCNSARCNAPDLKLDPAVKVVPGLIPLGK